jgi:CheY-like chemotaxis protein
MARILVIDDDADIRPLLRVTLTKAGHEPTLAARGQEGLQLAETGRFDLIVLDLMMPDVDGYEVTRRLRAQEATRAVPILILTARAQPADYEGAIEAGADEYMPKPFDPEHFVHRVSEMLTTAGARRAAAPAAARANAGQVTLVLGLRGGVGATTTAITLAGALQRAGRRVCLVDLSPNAGHVTLHLRVAANTTWASLPAAPDANSVVQLLIRHESGLLVLAAPAHPVRSGPPASAWRPVLEALQIYFTDVIVDAAPTLDEATELTASAANRILLLCIPEVSSIHTTVGLLPWLAERRRPRSRVELALNHVSPDHNLPVAAVEKALGRSPDFVIPYDRQQPVALTTGTPLIFSQPGALLPAAVAAYAAKIKESA